MPGQPPLVPLDPNGVPKYGPLNSGGEVSSSTVDENGNLVVSLGTRLAGEDLQNDLQKSEDQSNYTNLTASGQIKAGAGRLKGIFIAAASSTPTIKVWDNTAGSGTVLLGTFTPTAGQLLRLPDVLFATGCYVTISGTVDCTVFYK